MNGMIATIVDIRNAMRGTVICCFMGNDQTAEIKLSRLELLQRATSTGVAPQKIIITIIITITIIIMPLMCRTIGFAVLLKLIANFPSLFNVVLVARWLMLSYLAKDVGAKKETPGSDGAFRWSI